MALTCGNVVAPQVVLRRCALQDFSRGVPPYVVDPPHALSGSVLTLRESHGLSEDDAFNVLRHISQQHNVRLRDIAQRVRRDPGGPSAGGRSER
ncbi:ANTAR domain-containing protein [Streptomyces sp. NPDC007856]|uniref:ANTAR domain-containing protein n=1 Tax=Streptomyces sp. NPDC007856 TaxID=3364781 RepID=UPI00367B8039